MLITLVLTETGDAFRLSTVRAASLVSGAFIARWLGGAVLGGGGSGAAGPVADGRPDPHDDDAKGTPLRG